MKAPSILLFAGLLTLCTARPAPAVMTEYSTTNRTVAVTNVLPTSEVRPVAAFILFPTPATGTVSIARVTRGVAVPLARHGFTNAGALTWFPPADYPIRRGEALSVSSTVARFTLQLETTAYGDAVQRTDAAEWYDEGRPFSAQVAGGSSQVTVSNAQTVIITNLVTVNAGGGGPQFTVGPGGEYVATNALSMDTFGLSGPNVSAVLDWDGWVDFSGYFAIPAKMTGGSAIRTGEMLFDPSQGASGRFYGYRNDGWKAFLLEDEAGGNGPQFQAGASGEYIATNGTVLGLQNFDFVIAAVGNDGASGRNIVLQAGDSAGSGTVGGNIIAKLGNGDVGAGTWDFRVTDAGGNAVARIRSDGVIQSLGTTARFSLNDQAAVYLNAGDLYVRGKDNAPEEGNDIILLGGNGAEGGGDGGAIILRPGSSPVGNAGFVQLQDASGNNIFEVSALGTISAGGTAGVTEDLTVGDGLGGTYTLHFVKGIYTGHTIP